MSNLLSDWSKNIQSVPENYVVPEEQRPGDIVVPISNNIPVVDLAQVGGLHHDEIVQQIMKASMDYGLFQVINHGVPEELMDDIMSLFKQFLDMPVEDKAAYYSEDPTKKFRIYTNRFNYHVKNQVNCWKDVVTHSCHPLEDNIQFWPEKPARYRELVGAYSMEVKKLSTTILDLIGEGLGVQLGYFGGDLSKKQALVVNHYPPCPDPSLVLGINGHTDPNLLTLLQQEVYGLQHFEDGKWVGVEPLPHAFVILIAKQLEIISNGKVKSPLHRVVTNTSVARTSICTFIVPSEETIIEPAKVLVTEFMNLDLVKPITSNRHVANYLCGVQGTGEESYKLKD